MQNKTILSIIFGLILILSFSIIAIAHDENNSIDDEDNDRDEEDENDDVNEDRDDIDEENERNRTIKKEIKIEKKQRIRDEQGRIKEVELKIEKKEENGKIKSKIKIREREIESDIELEEEKEKNKDETKIKAKLSNGNRTEINLLPDKALEIAQLMLASENITNVSLELKEIKMKGNKLKAVYIATSNSTGRFLGIIKIKVKKRV